MERILQDQKKDKELKQQVIELYRVESKFKRLKKEYEDKKSNLVVAIKNQMFCNKGHWNEFRFGAKNGDRRVTMSVKKVEPVSIVWDADKLESALSKEVAKQVIVKTYEITDYAGLVKYLRGCGVDPKKFKRFVAVHKSVDEQSLDQLDALGEIDHNDIEGCYTKKVRSDYLRVDMLEDA